MPDFYETEKHYFYVDLALRYGVNAAILLDNIHFWISKNKANGTNFHDGYTWTYNSIEALSKQFPYLSAKQIRTALLKLKDEGIIITGNYSNNAFNRTTWYALTEYGESIFRIKRECDELKGQNDFAERENDICPKGKNPFVQKGKCSITDNNITDINTDIGVQKTRTRKTQPKNTYGEYSNVKLTDQEYERLVNDYGEQDTRSAIKFLDEYIEEKGYKSKSHNLALRRWVFDAVQQHRAKIGSKKASGDYDWGEIKRSLEHDT